MGMHRGGPHFDPSRLDKVTRGEIDQSVVATGKVQPITKIELKSKASGIVQNLYVDINQHVHKGQLLAQLDRQEIMAEVDAQRATLQAAEANVKSAAASIEHDKVDASALKKLIHTAIEYNAAKRTGKAAPKAKARAGKKK